MFACLCVCVGAAFYECTGRSEGGRSGERKTEEQRTEEGEGFGVQFDSWPVYNSYFLVKVSPVVSVRCAADAAASEMTGCWKRPTTSRPFFS